MLHTRKPLGYAAPIALIIILAVAAALRFYNINWDNGIFAHPDERSTVAFYAPTIQWPEDDSISPLDTRQSRLNPFWNVDAQERRSYTYGHFPLYTLVLTADFLNGLLPVAAWLPFDVPAEWINVLATAQSGHGYARIGRFLAALADLFTVYLLFLIGRRLYGAWGGVLAAAFSTFTVLQIQLAHFFAVDPISTTFTILALYGAMLLYDRQSVGAAIITGTGMALAVASKFSALPVVIIPVVAGYLAVRHHKTPPITNNQLQNTNRQSPTSRMVRLVLLSLAVAFVIFAVTSPFVLLDFENFKRAVLDEQGNMVSGVADFPFTRQYRHTTAYWYFIEQQLRWGMGWALGLLGLAGTLWVVIKTIRGKAQVGEILALLWLILYFGPTGLFLAKFMRYMVPVVPLISLFGAGLIVALWRFKPKANTPVQWAASEAADTNHQLTISNEQLAISQEQQAESNPQPPTPNPKSHIPHPTSQIPKAAAVLISIIVLGSTIFWSLAFVNGVYGTEHPWLTFSRWIYTNVPDGACIAYEHWDDRMPTDIPEPGGNPGAHQYHQPILPMYDEDTQQKYEYLRDTLMNCDYVALATNRLWRTIPRLPARYPMSTRYYEALFSGELGFEQIYAAETPPRLGPITINDQPADESFTVYDHPKPILFKKTRQLSIAEWDAILGNTWQQAVPYYTGPATLLMRLRGATDNPPAAQPNQDSDEAEALLLDTPVDQLPPVDDYRWNNTANNSPFAATVIWWCVVVFIGVMTFPLTYLLFNQLPDRGYGLSKSFGLLLISYFVWINSSINNWIPWLGNTLTTIIIALILFFNIGLLLFIINRRELVDFLRQQRWPIVITELIFSLSFLIFVYLRVLNPDLWHPWLGGEKMMEIAFLNAVVKSAQMPPYDPFFAGGIMNYYYYGLFLVGVLVKLTGIAPAIAFNLAVPTLAALTAISAFSLAGNLAVASNRKANSHSLLKMMSAGLPAILFVVFMGNLEGAAQFMRNLAELSVSDFNSGVPGLATLVPAISGFFEVFSGQSLATYNYWDPTRVIPQTINEFPYFSFLFADLHPHMIGIPFTLLFLSLAFNWLQTTNNPKDTDSENSSLTPSTNSGQAFHPSSFILHPSSFIRWLALPFALGAIAVINTWDLPTYLGLMVAAFMLSRYRQQGLGNLRQVVILLISSALFAIGLLVVTYLLYLPFFAYYHPPAETGLGLVSDRTPLDQHLKIWGFFIFIILSWLWISLLYPGSRNSLLRVLGTALRRWNVFPRFIQLYKRVVKREGDFYQLGLWSVGLVLLVTAGLFLLGYRVPAYLLPLVALSLLLLFRPEVSAATAFVGLLSFTGLIILLGVEFVYLEDFLGGGDYYRMNTLFKFFTQVWIIFGLAAAVVLPQLWNWAWRWPYWGQILWRGAVIILLLAGLVYPIFGTRTRVDDRFPGDHNRPAIGTLDGLAYMTTGTFNWPANNPIELKYDYEAIRWLQNNVTGTPILAEAKIGYYREGGMRVAAYTGLPSVLGGLHQGEQRPGSQIGSRDWVVNEFWQSPDPARTAQLMDELGISYIYVGQVERATYGNQIDAKFDQLHNQGRLELVFENEKTRIYKRKT